MRFPDCSGASIRDWNSKCRRDHLCRLHNSRHNQAILGTTFRLPTPNGLPDLAQNHATFGTIAQVTSGVDPGARTMYE
jgi:hypothetical protein